MTGRWLRMCLRFFECPFFWMSRSFRISGYTLFFLMSRSFRMSALSLWAPRIMWMSRFCSFFTFHNFRVPLIFQCPPFFKRPCFFDCDGFFPQDPVSVKISLKFIFLYVLSFFSYFVVFLGTQLDKKNCSMDPKSPNGPAGPMSPVCPKGPVGPNGPRALRARPSLECHKIWKFKIVGMS